MATLVLTTVGSLIGGPVGGAIGSLIGSGIDARLLAPKGRQGARLGQLAVQTSSYGTQLPKLFGTMRVAGTVIWATDLRETRTGGGGGKGRPRTTGYSYSASFAVALSARAIRGVERIWADGKLLRGAGGDWKAETGFRLHIGDEGQAVDPLIASAEGVGATPAYRGIAYAVFEDLQLADFGNRIPSLTFEVEADAAPVPVTTIAGALSDGAIDGQGGTALSGYAAMGDSVRGALETLAQAMPLVPVERAGQLTLDRPPGVRPIGGDARPAIERRAAGTVADAVTIAYHDPARDWQAGLQRATRDGPARRTEAIELAAAISAAEAKALAEARLARDWAGRTTATLALPWAAIGLAPGDRVTLPGRGETWRVTGGTLSRDGVSLELVALPGAAPVPPADAGRALPGPDDAAGATYLAVLDLPATEDGAIDVPRLWIAAAGTAPGWRRAVIEGSVDGGGSWTTIGASPMPAVIGMTATMLGMAGAALRDMHNGVDVLLLHDDMVLAGRADTASVADANLALIGDELVQFASAERIGPARWRLGGLLRGRRGTEPDAAHPAGSRFVLIERAALLAWDMPVAAIGAIVAVTARGRGDAGPVRQDVVAAGRSLRPPAPVHLRAAPDGAGGYVLHWTRRSRRGWSWIDGGDAPLAEAGERYRVEIAPGGIVRTIEGDAATLAYPATRRAADGFPPSGPLHVAVRQIGGAGLPSRAATIILE